MKIRLTLICLVFTILSSLTVSAQDIQNIDVSTLSDTEVADMWRNAQEQGFTIEQFRTLAIARGIPPSQVHELVLRINSLGIGSGDAGVAANEADDNSEFLGIDENADPLGLTGLEVKPNNETFFGGLEDDDEGDVFGYDFFNNPNISFTPNLNLSTPSNYMLGPGDQLIISVWGAAENSYNKEISREGAIRIQGVGPIYISGMPMEVAISKIKGKLKNIYAGISASQNSQAKIFVDVSLVKVRTVQVNIIGEVKVPGTYSLSSLSTVLNALYASGGPTKDGTFRNVKLVRNGKEVAIFDIYNYLLAGSQEGNLTLQDQDVIIVSPYISRIKISGSVKRVGLYEVKPSETLKDLIRFMGGFKSDAYKDRIVLERIEGDRRVIKELLFSNSSNEFLKDGDVLFVNMIIDKFENKISIEGAVFRPGSYEHTAGITLFDLIEKAAGVTERVFLDRGLLFSTNDGLTKTAEPFSVADVLNGTKNITLKPNDVVKIFDKFDLKESKILSIDGAVNTPRSFRYMENITIEDLVILAGGFKDGADVGVIDVFRRIKDNEFETLSKTFKVSSKGDLTIDGDQNFILQPNDRVSVRYLKGYSEQIIVKVDGEVNYPGAYSIELKGERISDLVNRSGGLSPYAFIEGATLIRRNPYFKDEAIDNVFENLKTEDSTTTKKYNDLNNQEDFKVGIDLQKILEDPNSKFNLVLKNGDKLIIPSVKETVKVQGEVLAPSLIRFDKSNSLKDYINKSGGFSSKSRKGKTYVIYSNGDIASTKSFLFFRSYPKLKPGAIILVPRKPDARNLSAQEVIGITTGITTFGLLVDRLLR